MIKPDLLVMQPDSADYPLWRKSFRENRHRFADVHIIIAQSNMRIRLTQFLVEELQKDAVIFHYFDPQNTPGRGDWADKAWHLAIDSMVGDYYLMWHQDFLVKNEGFWDVVFTAAMDTQLIGFFEGPRAGTRFCPGFFLVKFDLFQKTCQSFSVGYAELKGAAYGKLDGQVIQVDHLGIISNELLQLYPNYKTLEDLGFYEPDDWEHIKGLTQAYHLLQLDQTPNEVAYYSPRFVKLNKQMLEMGLHSAPDFQPYIIKAASVV